MNESYIRQPSKVYKPQGLAPGEWTRTDETIGHAPHNGRTRPPVTLRRFYHDGTLHRIDVFVGGWRAGTYKTERGAIARARKEVES